MTVTAIGVKGSRIARATNYNKTECTGEVGNCGCIHAEIALLERMTPDVVYLSHSPCEACAIALKGAGVKEVYYHSEYRLRTGIDILTSGGVLCEKL